MVIDLESILWVLSSAEQKPNFCDRSEQIVPKQPHGLWPLFFINKKENPHKKKNNRKTPIMVSSNKPPTPAAQRASGSSEIAGVQFTADSSTPNKSLRSPLPPGSERKPPHNSTRLSGSVFRRVPQTPTAYTFGRDATPPIISITIFLVCYFLELNKKNQQSRNHPFTRWWGGDLVGVLIPTRGEKKITDGEKQKRFGRFWNNHHHYDAVIACLVLGTELTLKRGVLFL